MTMSDLLTQLREHSEQHKPCRLIGFDIQMRLCWWWPFADIRIGRVWKLSGISAKKAIKHELAP